MPSSTFDITLATTVPCEFSLVPSDTAKLSLTPSGTLPGETSDPLCNDKKTNDKKDSDGECESETNDTVDEESNKRNNVSVTKFLGSVAKIVHAESGLVL